MINKIQLSLRISDVEQLMCILQDNITEEKYEEALCTIDEAFLLLNKISDRLEEQVDSDYNK